MLTTTVVLPTFNEVDNLSLLIKSIIELQHPSIKTILVVDDNSPDGTGAKADDLSSQNEIVSVIHRTTKRGLTNSLNAGIQSSTTDIIIWLDSDLQMPATLIPKLLKKINEGFDVVIGSRFIEGGDDLRYDKNKSQFKVLIHKMLSKIMCYFFFYVLRLPVLDISSGYIAIRSNVFDTYELEGDHGEYFLALILHIKRMSLKITEIPYKLTPRLHGASKTQENGYIGMIKIGFNFLKKAIGK